MNVKGSFADKYPVGGALVGRVRGRDARREEAADAGRILGVPAAEKLYEKVGEVFGGVVGIYRDERICQPVFVKRLNGLLGCTATIRNIGEWEWGNIVGRRGGVGRRCRREGRN